MRTNGKIHSFSEIMDEVFYDWGMTSDPQIHSDEPDSFWINKTSIFKENEKYYLNYKMDTWELTQDSFEQFQVFYDMFNGDAEFQSCLDSIENDWFKKIPFSRTAKSFTISGVTFSADNFKYYMTDSTTHKEINKRSFQKVTKFTEMLGV